MLVLISHCNSKQDMTHRDTVGLAHKFPAEVRFSFGKAAFHQLGASDLAPALGVARHHALAGSSDSDCYGCSSDDDGAGSTIYCDVATCMLTLDDGRGHGRGSDDDGAGGASSLVTLVILQLGWGSNEDSRGSRRGGGLCRRLGWRHMVLALRAITALYRY